MVTFWATATGAVTSSTVTTAVLVLELLQSSVTVKVTVLVPTCVQSKAVWSTDKVTSPHASEEPSFTSAASMDALPEAFNWMVMSFVTVTGAVVSSIVKVADVEVVLPHASVAVKITVAAPVEPHKSLSELKSLVHVTLPHTSEASAPPLSASQAVNSALFPEPSHSTVSSAADVSMLGSVVSSMVNVPDVVVALPHASVAVKVTVAAPVEPHKSLRALKSLLQVTSPHTSVACAPPLLANQAVSAALLPEPSHSTVWSEAAVSMLGAVVSWMVNVADVEFVLPQSSVAVNVTVVAPVAPHKSLNAL